MWRQPIERNAIIPYNIKAVFHEIQTRRKSAVFLSWVLLLILMNENPEKLIDALLDEVEAKNSPEKVKRIIQRASAAWNNDYPKDGLIYSVTENLGKIRGFAEIGPCLDKASGLPQKQKDLLLQLRLISNNSDWDNDFYYGIPSGLRQIAMPSYFGCEEYDNGTTTVVRPSIKTAGDIYSMKPRGFVKGSAGLDILETMEYFLERIKGRLPIYITDMQGPFSVAAQVMGIENFMMTLYDDPGAARLLLDKCTDAIIEYFHLMYGAIGEKLVPLHCHPLVYMPRSKGVAVSDDFFAITGKEIVEEFSKPYLERIAAEFGGVVVHSCGNINHLTDMINNIKGLTGVNFSATETDLTAFAEKTDKHIVIIAHNSPVTCGDIPMRDQYQHVLHCADVHKKTKASVICIALGFDDKYNAPEHRELFRKAAA